MNLYVDTLRIVFLSEGLLPSKCYNNMTFDGAKRTIHPLSDALFRQG